LKAADPPEDPDAFVLARLKPKPFAGSGAIALPEPEEPEIVEFISGPPRSSD
jgi:hypothetical protein